MTQETKFEFVQNSSLSPTVAQAEQSLLNLVTALSGHAAVGAVSFTTTADKSETLPAVTITKNNHFTGTVTTLSAHSLAGCIRACSSSNEGETAAEQAIVTSWLENVEQTVWTVLMEKDKDTNITTVQDAVQNFLQDVSTQLSKQSWLVSDKNITIADVVVACSLVIAGSSSIPTNVQEWMKRTLERVLTCVDKDNKTVVETWLKAVDTTATAAATTTTTATLLNLTDCQDNTVIAAVQNRLSDTNFQVYQHAPCMTAEELVQHVPLSLQETHTKNLFFKDKKHGYFLVSVRANAAVNTKQLASQLQLAGKTNFRLAEESALMEQLRVKPGCVGPLSVLQDGIPVRTTANDNNNDDDDKTAITVVLDASLLIDGKFTKIYSHPLRNDMSVALTPAQLVTCLAGIDYKAIEFEDAAAGKAPANRPPVESGSNKQQQQPKPKKQQQDKKTAKKGDTLLALQWKKTEHFANWYTDVIVLSEMISYYDISGCYILRPWSYKMWELIQEWFNVQIAKLGVENAYFPLFVSKDRLEKEKDHVEGFAPEVAWVTKSGDGDLAMPIAIRPTSETIMYPAFGDWIRSHRDLPLKLNQWSNVVRWEFKYPTPFLRTREFLWQEGHTAHATFEQADEMVMAALNLYKGVYEELLAVPVVPGYKTEKEKFAGGYRTTTVEAYIAGSGRAIQGATSHNLGQNFGKMFDITFQGTDGSTQTAWQTSWGLTTRTIGVMVMVHGDDTGLVLPPRVAPVQVVIVPIISKHLKLEDALPYCQQILAELEGAGVRARVDDRDAYNPGWKYNHWEQKGVPIRFEVGPKDMEKNSVRAVVRHDGSKQDIAVAGIGATAADMLVQIQNAMFAKATAARDSHIVKVTEWKDFVPNLERNNLVLTPWCGGEHQDWEEWVKNTSREESLKSLGQEGEDEKTATSVAAKTLCIPFDQPDLPAGTKCIASGMDATCWVLWGRSY